MKSRTKQLEETVQRLEWRIAHLEKDVERTADFFGGRITTIEERAFTLQPREFMVDGGHKVNVESLLVLLAGLSNAGMTVVRDSSAWK